MTKPGDVGVDYETGAVYFDDGKRRRIIATGGNVDAREWGVRPGNTDMTSQIQAAADGVPEGATLVFPAGTYPISDTIWFSRAASIKADGVIFDLATNTPSTAFTTTGIPENHDGTSALNITSREAGTLTTLAGVVFGKRSADRVYYIYCRGLRVIRTAADATAGSRLYAGIVLKGTFECTFEDLFCEDFREGIVLTSESEGCVHNRIIRPKVQETRYPFTLHAADSGWTNSNYFYDGRALVSSAITGDSDWSGNGKYRWEILRVMWSTTSTHRPNQNQFYNMNLETNCARKIRLEGSDNGFIHCRYENASIDSYDITIGEVSRASSNWDLNNFHGGYALDACYNGRIEYLATVSGINNKNMFYTGERWGWCAQYKDTLFSIGGTSHDTPLLSLQDRQFPYIRKEKLIGYAEVPDSIDSDLDGGFTFLSSSEVVLNYMGLSKTSPYPIKVGGAFRVAGQLILDSGLTLTLPLDLGGLATFNDVSSELEFYLDGAMCWMRAAGTGNVWKFYNSSSSNNDVIQILTATKVQRIGIKGTSTVLTSGHYGAIEFFDTTPTVVNGISLSSTSPYPLQFERGIYVNRGGGDYDTRYRTTGDLACLYIDAGNDRVGVGTSGPDAKLHVNGTFHAGSDAELDGALNHDGSSAGFYGVTPIGRPSAYTQTYSTGTKTHSNPTGATLTDSSGGTADQTVAAVSGSGDDTNINNNFADLTDETNKLIADVANVKQVLNQVIDDLQSLGLLQ